MSTERRQHPRVVQPVEGSWTGASGGASRCRIADISLGGCFVQSMSTATPGEATTITIPIGDHNLSLNGNVLYSEPGMGFAVRFGAIPQQDLDALTRLLDTLENGKPIL